MTHEIVSDDQAYADACEGVELLDDLISSITKDGNYSVEATLLFLGQIRQCFNNLSELNPDL